MSAHGACSRDVGLFARTRSRCMSATKNAMVRHDFSCYFNFHLTCSHGFKIQLPFSCPPLGGGGNAFPHKFHIVEFPGVIRFCRAVGL